MTNLIQNLIEGLREELKQYGEMLAMLDQQQEMLIRRVTQELLSNVASIHAQGTAIQAARHEREQRRLHLARFLALPERATFSQLLTRLPLHYQPLLQALVQENNDLLHRVQQRVRQNHLLLHRTLELMQQFLSTLDPASGAPVYDQAGGRLAPAGPQPSLYDAIG
jgi:flagellar biosynthesis/type III secretory pathway chaperone